MLPVILPRTHRLQCSLCISGATAYPLPCMSTSAAPERRLKRMERLTTAVIRVGFIDLGLAPQAYLPSMAYHGCVHLAAQQHGAAQCGLSPSLSPTAAG